MAKIFKIFTIFLLLGCSLIYGSPLSELTKNVAKSGEKPITDLMQASSKTQSNKLKNIPNIASRLGESVLLECGQQEHELLKQLETTEPSMPVLVNWFKHYSLTRRSDKPIYAKYLANNIDYAPHISRDYENRLQVIDKINLNISNLKAVDEALYECRLILFDKAYADSQTGSMFYLQVHVPPEFEYPNEEIVYYKPNVPIRLYCYARGKPTPSITWYKNGRKLESNTSVLQETFSSYDETSDIFEYTCKVENIVGQIEHTVKVIRSGSLFFTEPLKNLTVAEGTILNWPCLAQSNAEITYKWFKDSISVQTHLHKWSDRGALFQDGMLYLLETYRNDSGLYECHAFTANKRIETKAYLNVLYGPEIVPFQPVFYATEGSQSLVLDCVVKSNPSIVALEWFKDKYLLSNTNKYQILSNNSLLIKNIQKSDRGQYYCTCNNTMKKAVSTIIKLETIDLKSTDITTLYSSSNQISFKLPCRAITKTQQSSEQADIKNIKWFKLNSKLPINRFTVDSNGSLVLNNLRLSDSGMYLCKINDQSSDSASPKYKIINSNEKILLNENLIRLNVVQNKTNSNKHIFTSTETIKFTNEILSNSGEYEDGDASNTITSELPPTPENLQANQTKNGVMVTWTYPVSYNKDTINNKIEYFQIYFREVNDKSDSLNSNNLKINFEWKTTEAIQSYQNSFFIDETNFKENQNYEFQMVAFSAFSKSMPSIIVQLKYLPKTTSNNKSPNNENENMLPYIPQTILLDSMPFSLSKFSKISHLDSILITIFLILVFILIISIISCIVYRRSFISKKKRHSKKSNDLDDWGFQSSAATATFLSSSSSSEKSLNYYNTNNNRLNKTDPITTVDRDLTLKSKSKLQFESNNSTKPNILSQYGKPKFQQNIENETSKNLNTKNGTLQHGNLLSKASKIQIKDIIETNSLEDYYDDDDDDDGDEINKNNLIDNEDDDYYYSSDKNKKYNNRISFVNNGTANKQSNMKSESKFKSNTIGGYTNNRILYTNQSKIIEEKNNSGTSSGVTSGSNCTSAASNSSDCSIDDLQVSNDSNTEPIVTNKIIKYNAKTNILQQDNNGETQSETYTVNTISSKTAKPIIKYGKNSSFQGKVNQSHGIKFNLANENTNNTKYAYSSNKFSTLNKIAEKSYVMIPKKDYVKLNTNNNINNKITNYDNNDYGCRHKQNISGQHKSMLDSLLECNTNDVDKKYNCNSTEEEKVVILSNNSGNSGTITTSADSISNNKDDVYCYASNDSGGGISGVSFNVDASDLNSENIKEALLLDNENNENMKFLKTLENNNGECWNISDDASLSMTPVESSTYSNTSVSPPLTKFNFHKQQQIKNMNELNSTLLPFPTSAAMTAANATIANVSLSKNVHRLNSNSSLTMMSNNRMPPSSYYTNNDMIMINVDKQNQIYATTGSSSSSGCSSLENPVQYYQTIMNNDVNYANHSNFIDNSNMKLNESNHNQSQHMSYKPIPKSSLNNTNNNLNSHESGSFTVTTTKKPVVKKPINSSTTNYASSTFKASKVDYV